MFHNRGKGRLMYLSLKSLFIGCLVSSVYIIPHRVTKKKVGCIPKEFLISIWEEGEILGEEGWGRGEDCNKRCRYNLQELNMPSLGFRIFENVSGNNKFGT